MGYLPDPNNPGWLLLEGADPAQESSWWQIPEGFVADQSNPGWYYREGGDVNQQENWAHDPSVQDEPQAGSVTPGITVERIPGTVAGAFASQPQGVILHGSRSGSSNDAMREYQGTARYAGSGIELGWNATVGPGIYAVHMPGTHWGWNARAASQKFLAVEFAQATIDQPIDDSMVDAFVQWLQLEALPVWPGLPMHFPSHAEVEAAGLTGARDGKTDCWPGGDPRLDDLRARIGARLGFEPAPPMTPDEAHIGGFSMEPDHQFSLAELWPLIQEYSNASGTDPRILAGMVQQESTYHNYRVHRDGTGHGLLGLDDNGLLADFEAWSGLSVGRGPSASIIPVEPQLEFAARQLRRYQDAYPGEGEYVGARAWHAGGGGRNSNRGQDYERLIRARIAELGL